MVAIISSPAPEKKRHLIEEDYRGWTIAWQPSASVTPVDTAPAGSGAAVQSIWLANLMAIKVRPNEPGVHYCVQPLWLTRGQMEICKTPLDLQAADAYMVDMGLKRIRAAIDRYEDGLDQPEVLTSPPPDLDPTKPGDLDRVRIEVGPAGLKINPPQK